MQVRMCVVVNPGPRGGKGVKCDFLQEIREPEQQTASYSTFSALQEEDSISATTPFPVFTVPLLVQ